MTKRAPPPRKKSKLTDKQRRFVQEYFVDMNATQAAKRAGYSARTADVKGGQLLKLPFVARAIAEKQATIAEKFQVTHDRVMRELSHVGYVKVPKKSISGSEKIRALELMGKHVGMWTREDAELQRVGPGLTVIVQTAVNVQPRANGEAPRVAQAGRIEVNLPGPARSNV